MKSVLISIQPKWCELIASGKKTVEIRKSKPKIEAPFKVYIYCTKQGKRFIHGGIGEKECLFKNPDTQDIKFDFAFELMCCKNEYTEDNFLSGKAIGEFVCNNIDWHGLSNLIVKEDAEHTLSGTCLTKEEVSNYLGYQKGTNIYACKNYDFYGWHISNLKIYDKPKKLGEFSKECKCKCDMRSLNEPPCEKCDKSKITRPPQSWCYVEEKE